MSCIGRYEIERELGRGAMGVVYLARDPRVRRPVAVKTCRVPPGLSPEKQREYQERFLREAQSAGALVHPAIVTIYDAGEDPTAGTPYIAMEYVEGETLRERLQREPVLPVTLARTLAADLASGLHAAHAAGVIHRDVKPANILIRARDGVAKIADFGIARLDSSELTRSGESLGSPAYMAPEQIRGGVVDGRTDLFSLAVILYETLCGRRPFTGADLPALAYAVVHESPLPVTRLRAGLPPGLDGFFAQALAKDPAARFPHGEAFREALLAAWRPESPGARAPAGEATLVQADVSVLPAQPACREMAASELLAGGSAAPARRPSPGRALGMALHRLGGALGRLSPQGRMMMLAGIFALAAAGVWGSWVVAGRAAVVLDVKNHFPAGTLTVSVDGTPAYIRGLSAERKNVKAFGRKFLEWGQEEFETRLRLAPGSHEILVEVEAEGEPAPHRQRLTLAVEAGETRRLRLTTGKSRAPLSVKLD